MKKNPVVLLPGLLEDADGFAHQVAGLAEVADVVVADLTRSDSMQALARDALAQAPGGRFALAAHSMGGYVAFEMLRQAPERIRASPSTAAEAPVASLKMRPESEICPPASR